ncbi:MAG: DciA family protein [Myxococcota bacterium]
MASDVRERDTARQLLSLLRRHLDDGRRADAARLIEVTLVQLTRPGAPAARLGSEQRDLLRKELALLASRYAELADSTALARFCAEAAAAAWRRVPRGRHTKPLEDAVGSTKDLARRALLTEYARSHDDVDLVQRALTRALRERRSHRQRTVRVDVEDRDVMRELLDLPSQGAVRLPPNDIRVHLAGAFDRDGQRSALPAVLRKAARFSEKALRPVLGEELWGLCRPVGFADRHERVVIVQVPNAAAAHEVQLRKRELLHRLCAVPGHERVREVRFAVVDERPSRTKPWDPR